MKVKEILEVTRAKLLSGDTGAEIDLSAISTDSRTISRGELFVALKGANFDGNNFVESALKKGAAGAVVTGRWKQGGKGSKIIISVEDTTRALQDIAASHRRRFSIPVIAVTGSNGKTTVKDMIAACLAKKFNVLKNKGTENNHIGVPQTLLRLNASHEICILELGANHRGEIASLGAIARPDIAVITNIGPSHLKFFGNLEGVYKAKKEIAGSLDDDGVLVLNGDDRHLARMKHARHRILRYGFNKTCDFIAKALLPPPKDLLTFVVNNRMVFELNLVGIHNIYNALAAITVANIFNIGYKSVREALFDYRPTPRRLVLERIGSVNVIDDSYNSNPLSMACALEVLKYYPASARWVACGDMLELGNGAVRMHRAVGKLVAESGVDGLLTFGKLSRHTLSQAASSGMPKERLWHCSTHDAIAGILKRFAKDGDIVLLKGSRGMCMEKVLSKLKG